MKRVGEFLLLLFLTPIEARFSNVNMPSLFWIFFYLFLIKNGRERMKLYLWLFFIGIVIDAIEPQRIWIYPLLLPLLAGAFIDLKSRLNLSLMPVRFLFFEFFILLGFLPLVFYYHLSAKILFFKILLTGVFIELIVEVLWRGALE